MSENEYVQIPIFRCGGRIAFFQNIIKDLKATGKYEIIEDSANITIKSKENLKTLLKQKVKVD